MKIPARWRMGDDINYSDLKHKPMTSSPAHVRSTIINKKTKSKYPAIQIKNRIRPSKHKNHESKTGSGHPGIQIKKLSNPNPREKGKEEDGDEITGEKASEGDERWMIDCGVAAAAMPHCWFAAQPLSAARCCAAPSSSPTRTGAEKIFVKSTVNFPSECKTKAPLSYNQLNCRACSFPCASSEAASQERDIHGL